MALKSSYRKLWSALPYFYRKGSAFLNDRSLALPCITRAAALENLNTETIYPEDVRSNMFSPPSNGKRSNLGHLYPSISGSCYARNSSIWSSRSCLFSSEATKEGTVEGHKSVADEICIALKSSPWGPDVEKALQGHLLHISPQVVVEVLRRRCTHPSRLFEFFRWLENQPNYHHTIAVYHTMVMVLAERQKFEEAQTLVEEMHKQGLQVCTAASILIKNFGKRCKVRKSWNVLNDLRSVKGCPPNGQVYNELVRVLMKMKYYEKVLLIFEEMVNAGVKVGATHLGSLLYFYEKVENPEAILSLFKQLIERGILSANTFYRALIGSCSRRGRLTDAYTLFLDLIQGGIIPDKDIYQMLVDALEKAEESEKAGICKEMYASLQINHKDSKISSIACDGAISLASESTNQPIVVDICNILSQSSWGPDKETVLASLLGALQPSHVAEVLQHKSIDSKQALMFFKWLGQQSGYEHTISTYHAMIGLLSKENDFDSAYELLDVMHKNDLDVKTAMSIIIRAYGRSGTLEEASQAFERLRTLDCEPNVQVYNAMIGVHLRFRNYEKVLSTYKEMSEVSQVPNVGNLRNLLYFYQTAEKPEEVYKIFEELKEKALIPLGIGYNVFVDGLSNSGKLQEACKLFEEMAVVSHEDVKRKLIRTYNTLKCQLRKTGDLKTAQFFHDLMLEKGFAANLLV